MESTSDGLRETNVRVSETEAHTFGE